MLETFGPLSKGMFSKLAYGFTQKPASSSFVRRGEKDPTTVASAVGIRAYFPALINDIRSIYWMFINVSACWNA